MNDNDRSIVLFASVTHALVHTYELSIPILVVVWLAEFSASTATFGLVAAVGYALFGLGALPGGIAADRIGSRRLILGCLVGMGTSFLLLSFASGVLTIALALAVWGAAASVYHPAGLSLISTGVAARGSGFAYHGMAGNVGIAFGPLVTALLLLQFEWPVVTAILASLAVLAALSSFRLDFDPTAAAGGAAAPDSDGVATVATGDGTDTTSDGTITAGDGTVTTGDGTTVDAAGGPRRGLDDVIADSRRLFTVAFVLAFLVACASGLFYRGTLTFLPDVLGGYLPDLTEYVQLFEPGSRLADRFDLAAYVYAGLLVVGIGGQYVGGRLTDRIRPSRGIAGFFGLLALISVAFVPAAEAGLLPLLLISAAMGFTLFAVQPLYQAMIAEQSPPDARGLSYGVTYLAVFGVGAAGAAVAGILLSITTVHGTFLALAAIPAVGAVLAFVLSRR